MEELIGEEHQQRGDGLKQDAVRDVTGRESGSISFSCTATSSELILKTITAIRMPTVAWRRGVLMPRDGKGGGGKGCRGANDKTATVSRVCVNLFRRHQGDYVHRDALKRLCLSATG